MILVELISNETISSPSPIFCPSCCPQKGEWPLGPGAAAPLFVCEPRSDARWVESPVSQ